MSTVSIPDVARFHPDRASLSFYATAVHYMFKKMSIRMRLLGAMGLLGLILLAFAALGLLGIRNLEAALKDVYTNQLLSSIAINESKDFLSRARFAMDRTALHPEAADVSAMIERARGFIKESDKAWAAYMAQPQEPEEKVLAQAVVARRDSYIRDGLMGLADAIAKKDLQAVDRLR